jgi:hypothetical protein
MVASTPALHLGVDLDNTLVSYDRVFLDAARAWGLVGERFRGHRIALRAAIRALPDGELRWQRLQAEVYAHRMQQARLMPGAAAFLARCRRHGVAVSIVSHKTRHAAADPQRVDLRALALDWLRDQGLLDPARFGLDPQRVHFADSRADKLRRIAELGCTDFVDDLPELLADPNFPRGVRSHLLTPAGADWEHLWTDLCERLQAAAERLC